MRPLTLDEMDKLQLIQAGVIRSKRLEGGEYNYARRKKDGWLTLLCTHCTSLSLIGEGKPTTADGIYIFEKATIGLCESCGEFMIDDYGPFLGKFKNYLPASVVKEDSRLEEFGFD